MANAERGLTGSMLKWLAILTMTMDHIGAVVLTRVLRNCPYNRGAWAWCNERDTYELLFVIMRVCRTIGRLAFPIICFLLVEGFFRTSARKKYLGRLFVWAVLSEVPFDYAFSAEMVNWGFQNVMWTLLIGLTTMWVCEEIKKKSAERKVWLVTGSGLSVAAGMILAQLMNTDYGAKGIACIMVLYFFRNNRLLQIYMGALSFVWECFAMISFVFLAKYNGKRGSRMKSFFYIYYPAHLIVLYVFCLIWGIEGIAVV